MENQETNAEHEITDKNEGPGLFGFAAILTALFIGCSTMWYNGTKMVQWWHADQLVSGQAVVWDIFKEGGGYVGDFDLPKNRSSARLYGIFDLESQLYRIPIHLASLSPSLMKAKGVVVWQRGIGDGTAAINRCR